MQTKHRFTLIKKIVSAGLISASMMLSFQAKAANVDLLVVFDDHSRNYFNGQVAAAMRNWVAQTNQIYKNTGIDINLRLAGTMHKNIAGADMGEVLGKIRVNADIARKRDEVGADFVTQLHRTGACGLGYVAVSAAWAFNVVGPNCGGQVLAHELGHNMGLNHSRKQGNQGGSNYRYGLGYGVVNSFATTMAYPGVFNTSWVPKFSSPAFKCRGLQCGIWPGNANEADASLALNNVKGQIAGFRPAKQQKQGFILKARHSGKCLEVGGWSKEGGANIIQWNCHGGDNQRFRKLDGGDGYWLLQNVNSGKCLSVDQGNTNAGGNVVQRNCDGRENQRIMAANLFGSVHQFAFRHSGICIDVGGWGEQNGANIIQWSCTDGANQRFDMVK
ncbi:Endo-1,4-beta-xylanase A [Thalassocella blandensis]|nr:Endo-1,4-beta-xylanase A [Thalassocella blandensis]